jgi:hypothetical protein
VDLTVINVGAPIVKDLTQEAKEIVNDPTLPLANFREIVPPF